VNSHGRRVRGQLADCNYDAIIPAVREHLTVFVKDEPGALAFPGANGTTILA
jgi:hypothetical protein